MKSQGLVIQRRYSRHCFRLLAVLIVCIAFASPGIIPARASGYATCGPTLTVAISPALNATASWLNGVAAISDINVWAVGAQVPTGQNNQRTLTEHWNGIGWVVQPSGNEGGPTTLNELSAISAVNATNIWAVGDHGGAAPEKHRPLIEHWIGGAWHITSSPDLGPGDHYLTGVTAVSSTDVWTVGHTRNEAGDITTPIAEHWNGIGWSIVRVPIPPTGTLGPGSGFAAVSGSAGSDVWAVGWANPGPSERPLVEHWNGSRWSIVATPIVVSTLDNQYLEGVSSKATSDVWVVGTQQTGIYTLAGLVEHWNGTSWTVMLSPHPSGSSSNLLHAVSEVSATDVWAVGQDYTSGSGTLVDHWNGSAWTVVPSPNAASGAYGQNQLNSVSALPQGFVWTAGDDATNIPSPPRSLIEQQCG